MSKFEKTFWDVVVLADGVHQAKESFFASGLASTGDGVLGHQRPTRRWGPWPTYYRRGASRTEPSSWGSVVMVKFVPLASKFYSPGVHDPLGELVFVDRTFDFDDPLAVELPGDGPRLGDRAAVPRKDVLDLRALVRLRLRPSIASRRSPRRAVGTA